MSVAEMLARLVLSLGVVLLLLWVLARVVHAKGGRWGLPVVGRRTGGRRRRRGNSDAIEVTARHSLSKNASLAIVRLNGRRLLIGVTDTSVRVLDADLDADVESDPAQDSADLAPLDSPGRVRETGQKPLPTDPVHSSEDISALVASMDLSAGTSANLTPNGKSIDLRAPRTATSRPPRMSLTEALRELTLRRN